MPVAYSLARTFLFFPLAKNKKNVYGTCAAGSRFPAFTTSGGCWTHGAEREDRFCMELEETWRSKARSSTWKVSLTRVVLLSPPKRVLSLGLGFAPTPKKVSHSDIIVAIESTCTGSRKLRDQEGDDEDEIRVKDARKEKIRSVTKELYRERSPWLFLLISMMQRHLYKRMIWTRYLTIIISVTCFYLLMTMHVFQNQVLLKIVYVDIASRFECLEKLSQHRHQIWQTS